MEQFRAHATLLSDLWYSSCQRILISAQNRDLFTPHLVPALARAVRTIVGPRMMAVEENSSVFGPNRTGVDPTIADFVDTLQVCPKTRLRICNEKFRPHYSHSPTRWTRPSTRPSNKTPSSTFSTGRPCRRRCRTSSSETLRFASGHWSS